MLTFHPLELVRRRPIAEDAVCLELRPPPGLETAYRFEAGQHLAVRATIGGRELRRTYSIVSEAGGPLKIGVRVQGEMSRFLASGLPVGGRLESMEPTGRFRPTLEPGRSKRYAALAAGSGITPVLSIVSTLLAAEPHSRVLVAYGNRSIARSMFVDELLALKNRHLGRLSVVFVMSREPQDVELFNGRLDGPRLPPTGLLPRPARFRPLASPARPSDCCCPLAPAPHSAFRLAINICDVLVEEGGPRVEAKRRGGDPLPRASCRAKLRERAGSRLFVWVFGL